MKRYKVQLTAPAQADMLEIYRYISEELHNPTAAIRLYERIAQAILSLADTPERYGELHWNGEAVLRKIPVQNYLVIYTVTETAAVVLRVLYGASDIEKKLKQSPS